jgi:CRP-like cAMP-binding protein
VATHDVTFISLTYAALEDAEVEAPQAALRFHRTMARALGQKNRQSQAAYRAALL